MLTSQFIHSAETVEHKIINQWNSYNTKQLFLNHVHCVSPIWVDTRIARKIRALAYAVEQTNMIAQRNRSHQLLVGSPVVNSGVGQ